MRADRFKQVLKNSVYRTIGETAAMLGANGNGHRSLRVLMYHKVNDIPDNPTTVPVAHFDDQLAQLGELGYQVIDLDAVLEHYTLGTPLPDRAVLITFDDGYRDTLENAMPVLQKYDYKAVIFVPVAYMEDATPLPHESLLVERGVRNPTLDWGLMRELDAGGVRVESHGIAHRPLRERLAFDVVVEHGMQINGLVAELAQLVHLLVEERYGHRQRIARKVVDLVVHEHTQAAFAVAVGADRRRRLADRPVDGVLQHLLEAVCAHGDLA